jgi:hypothetical protein
MTKPRIEVDAEQLRLLLSYDPNTGDLTWKKRDLPKWDTRWAGKRAGSIKPNGYCVVTLMNRKGLRAHRVAWAITHGHWPKNEIDHIDGNPSNNRLSNLREANGSENYQNRVRYLNNKSGYMGVYRHNRVNKWVAQIRFNRKKHYLGMYDCPLEAHAAYLAAKVQLHTFNPVLREAEVA